MVINVQRLNDSPFVIKLISTLGRLLPLKLGHSLADYVAGRLAERKDSPMIRAIRANQWVARGETLDKEALDRAVYETLRNSARSIFDLYHYILNPRSAGRLIVLDPATQQLVRRPEFERRGLVVVGIHLSNSDLALQWLCSQGFRILVLTIPDPQGGRRTEYERRVKSGINIVPASVGALRQSLRYLQQGGVVLTGIDRPITSPGARPRFFGRPAALPTHHIFLATKARVPVMLMVTNLQADGKYHILTSDPIEMDPDPDREKGTIRNAEKVLNIAENFIRQVPQQWSISLPVWPETLDLAPE
jgi:phosphatidylinositol dimannoside acyltransferase